MGEKRQLLEQILKEIENEEALIEERRVQQQQIDEQQREQIEQQLDQQQLGQQQLQNFQQKLEAQRHRQVQQQQLAELYQHLEHQQQQLEKRLDELQRRHLTQKVASLTKKVFEVLLDCKESECESRVKDFEQKRAPISSLFEEFALDVVKEVKDTKTAEGKTF